MNKKSAVTITTLGFVTALSLHIIYNNVSFYIIVNAITQRRKQTAITQW